MLVSVKQLKKSTNHAPLTEGEEMQTATLTDETTKAVENDPVIKNITRNNVLGAEENLVKRREMIAAKAFEPTEFAYERSIGENDSLYSNFTELIAITKRKVGRIVIIKENKKIGCATGFLVAKDLLLTNWHVFEDASLAKESEIQFFYEYDADGHPITPVIFKLDTSKFFVADETLDYALVAVQPLDVTGKISLESIGYLYLDKGLGKLGEINKEKLNIIHHPNGDYKQISIRANLFVAIDETKLFYETDTAQGSSGSPVFNDQWQVVGLHHKSVGLMSADGKDYLDKDTNQPIPVINGKIDASRVKWLRNEGMRISVILNHLATTHPGDPYIASLDVPPPKEILQFSVNSNNHLQTNNNTMPNESSNNINISVPVTALNTENSIDISLSSKKILQQATGQAASPGAITALSAKDEMLLEIAKADKEDAVDFSKCKGYDPKFLGVNIPLPQPKKTILKQVARLKNNSIELKYFKYSVIFNAVKKMPLISAVNAQGDSEKRKDNSKRNDDWLRDKRIDKECQLTDGFYASSGFDKGHMSRFEDANWDDTEKDALRNGIYTCFYTNACPQVPGINRNGEDLWGKLEKAVLEKGIKKQTGKQARMTVFNGPVFDENKDRIRKGTVVPMQFYKIVLWLNDDNKLRATAFKLSQESLVTDDQFLERLALGEEAIDIDQNVDYKKYQCSIKSLSTATAIDFGPIEKYDTYKPRINGGEEMLIETEEAIML